MSNPIPEYDELWQGGYADGISDALHVVSQFPGNDAIERAIKVQLLGYVTCPDCNGDGENHKPTARDLKLGMIELLGGSTHSGHHRCRTCGGDGVLSREAARREARELVEDYHAAVL